MEIVDALGKVPTLKSGHSDNFIYIGLKPDNLDKKIRIRLLKRLEPIIRECRKLNRQGLSWKRMYELGLEYRYVGWYLRGRMTKQQMVEKLNTAIRQYAKRQMTWFKRNKEIKWFKLGEYKKIEKNVKRMIG